MFSIEDEYKKWDKDYILHLISNGVEESIHLDYKSADSLQITEQKKAEISKDVSSFANSEGGIIMYSMKEEGRPPKPIEVEVIDPNIITREWLESVINSRIERRIEGIKIKGIDLGDTFQNKIVYVVFIPQSAEAPHQAFDKKYYKRFNFQSVPMEDYEIRDVANRIKEPIIKIDIKCVTDIDINQFFTSRDHVDGTLNIGLVNVGKKVAQQICLDCYFPERYMKPLSIYSNLNYKDSTVDSIKYKHLRYFHSDSNKLLPLFPGMVSDIFNPQSGHLEMRLLEKDVEQSCLDYVKWIIYADGAIPSEGDISIHELFFGKKGKTYLRRNKA